MVVINRIELLFNAYETFVLPLNYMTIVWLLAAPSGIEPLFDDYQSSVRYATIKLRNSKLVGALGIEPSVVINWLKANYFVVKLYTEIWQRIQELNLRFLSQSQMCYRYTNPQHY